MGTVGERQSIADGTVVAGKYLIEEQIGEGGMGVVFAAMHIELRHRVALKVVREELAEQEEAVERLLREARNAARLRSEHVARVLDVSRLPSGAPYIVMEHLEGEDLGTHLNRLGRLGHEEAVMYLLEVCEAVAEAHALGIVHRDLKPENLFLTTRADGEDIVKVLDFGVSKHLSADPGGRLTNPRKVVGSPDYMAPEQMRANAENDVRADIWSLGAVLFELLTGLRPFEAETLAAVCARVLHEQPVPPRSIIEEIPEGLDAVVLCCLRKDPDARYQTVADLARALEPFGSPRSADLADRVQRVARVAQTSNRTPGSLDPVSADAIRTRSTLGRASARPLRAHRARKLVLPLAALVLAGVVVVAFRSAAQGAAAPPLRRFVLPAEVPRVQVAHPDPAPPAASNEGSKEASEEASEQASGEALEEASGEVSEDASEKPTESASGVKSSDTAERVPARPAVLVQPKPASAEEGAETVDAWDPSAFGGRR